MTPEPDEHVRQEGVEIRTGSECVVQGVARGGSCRGIKHSANLRGRRRLLENSVDGQIIMWFGVDFVLGHLFGMVQREVLSQDILERLEFVLPLEGLLIGKEPLDSLASGFTQWWWVEKAGQSNQVTSIDALVGGLEFFDDSFVFGC